MKLDKEELRKRAVAEVKNSQVDISKLSKSDIQTLVHELEVHQIQLKMQNDELKRFQNELENEKSRFVDLYDNAPIGYVTLGEDQQELQANETMANMLGCSKDQIERHSINEFIHWDDKDVFYLFLLNFKNHAELESCQVRFVTRNEQWFHANLTASYEIIGRLRLTISDITEIIEARKKEERSNKLKSAFLSNMSHEIRNPLNAILGFADLLGTKELSKKKKSAYLAHINHGGKRLLRLISDILDISKIESEQITITENPCSLNQILDNILAQFQVSNTNSDISIHTTKELSDEESGVLLDEQRLSQILSNLIENALKFTESGSIEFGYVVKDKEQVLQFYVKDSGVGIHEKDLLLIFERFVQANDDAERSLDGTGLGLSIVKGLLDLLGGEIWLESKINVGSTFYFTLPFRPSTFLNKKNEIEVADNRPKDLKGVTILIVEDNRINQLFFKSVLRDKGATTLSALNGKEAVDIVADNSSIDIILLDINMPVMNGFETIKRIKEIDQHIPVIAQTGYAMEEDINKIMQSNFNDYILKPIDQNKLINALLKYSPRH
ncbi:MAG: response regulator [Cyclobacteriaceae bacterium]